MDAARASGAPVFVGIGAGAVLLGSVLPIAGSMGRRASLFPDVIAQIPEAWLVPISAVLLLVGAALLNSLTDRMLAIVAGLCVAVASPGLVLFIVAASMGRQALDSVGPLSHLIEVGPGGVVLLAGYALALMGGLAALAGIPVSQEGEG